ncbi:sulfur carrier protein ThiS [Actinoplanes sp. NPDC051470]|uniref:sulfur carrier protein ThiS n=1 Tax=Actinoplanes sp. NPDC051470 TaxID=3157224 RepID=UPI003446827E
MTIVVNGDRKAIPPEATVAALVAELTRAERGVAVALNGEVVPRSAWAATELTDGDRIEVLTAAQGG